MRKVFVAVCALLAALVADAATTTLHAPQTLTLDVSGTATLRSNAPATTKVLIRLHSASGKVYTTTAHHPATVTITADGVWTLDADF